MGNNKILKIAITPDGKKLAAGNDDSEIRIYDMRNSFLLNTLKNT